MRNSQKLLEDLFARTTQGIKFGLKRITRAAEELDNPQNSFKSIHVAGTNGKGSVCAFCESILLCQGLVTGLFTSPHIHHFEERFRINGTCVLTGEWLAVYEDIEEIVNRYELTFFEISALIAFELFKRKNVEWAIIETGLGGRLDATNIIHPAASIITNIGIDHTEYLGSDIRSVAKEKLGIVKAQTPLIIAEQNYSEVIPLAQQVCTERHSPMHIVSYADATDLELNDSGSTFYYRDTALSIALSGKHQVINALCALKAVEVLDISDKRKVCEALGKAVLPARFQVASIKGKTIVFDVAHNPQAASVLCKTLTHQFGDLMISIVAGIMADKEKQAMMLNYTGCAANLIITRPKTPRVANPSELTQLVPESFNGTVTIIEDVGDAVHFAMEKFEGIICITGSFYTVGEAMAALGIEPY